MRGLFGGDAGTWGARLMLSWGFGVRLLFWEPSPSHPVTVQL